MTALAELARLIRSKNAGPFELTFDVMFDDASTYECVKRSSKLSREVVAGLYSLPLSDVKFFFCDHAPAIKTIIRRPSSRATRGTATATADSSTRRSWGWRFRSAQAPLYRDILCGIDVAAQVARRNGAREFTSTGVEP
jgi:hypothetical protein